MPSVGFYAAKGQHAPFQNFESFAANAITWTKANENAPHSSRKNAAGFCPNIRDAPRSPSATVSSSAAKAAPSAAGHENVKSNCMARVTMT